MKIGKKDINKVLFDVNVCIDVLTNRSLTNSETKNLFSILRKNKIKSYIPACSLDTIYYILIKMGIEKAFAKNALKKLIKYTGLAFLSDKAVKLAFDSEFKDFEDSLINSVAVINDIDVLITSNTKDFIKSSLLIFHPKDFISYYRNEI